MASRLSDPLASRLRALLRSADHPQDAAGSARDWHERRDAFLDRLDPRHSPELDDADIRQLVDFLSEAGPSRASRRTASEWSHSVDAVIPELLFASRPSGPLPGPLRAE